MIRSLIGATVGAFGRRDSVGLARTGEASMAEARSAPTPARSRPQHLCGESRFDRLTGKLVSLFLRWV
jgi:hypothetical protein